MCTYSTQCNRPLAIAHTSSLGGHKRSLAVAYVHVHLVDAGAQLTLHGLEFVQIVGMQLVNARDCIF